MPQTFSFGPTTAKQDAILTTIAAKRGVTVQALVDAEMARIFARFKNEYEQDDGARVAAAYTGATATVQNGVRTALGLP